MSGLTYAQYRLLKRLMDNPGSAVGIETRERDGMQGPSFHGWFHYRPCETCGHFERQSMPWRVIFALAEGDFIRPQLRGSDYYMAEGITEKGKAALSDAAD